MKKKRLLALFLALFMLFGGSTSVFADSGDGFSDSAVNYESPAKWTDISLITMGSLFRNNVIYIDAFIVGYPGTYKILSTLKLYQFTDFNQKTVIDSWSNGVFGSDQLSISESHNGYSQNADYQLELQVTVYRGISIDKTTVYKYIAP